MNEPVKLKRIDTHTPIILRPSPFRTETRQYMAAPGESIEGILLAFPDLPPEVWSHGVVRIGEWEIPRDRWHLVRPKPGTRHLVQVGIRVGGGGSGGKSIFTTLLAVALIVATTAITGGILGPAGALSVSTTLFAAGSTSAALLAAGVSVLGALALSALAPAPTKAAGNTTDDNKSDLGVASIQGNVLAPFDPIPFVAGRHRVAPPHLIPPWSESINDDQYVYAIVGLNGAHVLDDIRINDAPISDFEEIEYEVRDVINDDSDLTLITKQVFENQVGADLLGHKVKDDNTDELQDTSIPSNSFPKWQSARTRSMPDEVWLSFAWVGLINQESAGGTNEAGCPIAIRIRRVGDTGGWINLPEFHAQRERLEPFRGIIKLRWVEAPTFITSPDQTPSLPPWSYAFAVTLADNDEAEHVTNSYFTPFANKIATKVGIEEDGSLVVYLNPDIFPKGTYDIQVKRGYAYKATDLTVSSYRLSGSIPYFFTYTAGSNPPSIRKEQSKVASKVSWIAVSSVWDEYPLGEKGISLICVKAKNLAINNLTTVATGYANTFDGTDWDAFEPTANPAAWLRYVALGGQSVRAPFIAAQLDDASIEDLYEFCGSEDHIDYEGVLLNNVTSEGALTDVLVRHSGLTGAADSKLFTGSVWFKYDGDFSTEAEIICGGAALGGDWRLRVEVNTSGTISLVAANAAGTNILVASSTAVIKVRSWTHVMFSIDLANVSNRHLYVNDAGGISASTYTNDDIDFTLPDWAVGSAPDGDQRLNGGLAEIWFAPGVYIDLSIEANRRKFITAGIRPVDLGATGQIPTGVAPLIYLSNYADNFYTNKGSGGDFRYRSSIPMTFDGTNDYLTRGAGMTGAADSKQLTGSFWCRASAYNNFNRVFSTATTAGGGTERTRANFDASQVAFFLVNAAGSTIGDIRSTVLSVNVWHHVLFSFDLTSTSLRHIYIDGVPAIASAATFTNDTIDFTTGDWSIGGDADGQDKFPGDLAEIWLAPGVYIDFSNEANRRKFVTERGYPAFLGKTGELVTGVAPLIYLSQYDGAFATNKGTGGGYTTVGALVESTDTARLATGQLNPYPTQIFKPANHGLNREFNAFIDGSSSVGDVMRMAAGCGRAAIRVSDKIGVIIDNDRSAESPIQLFTQRNTRDLTIRRAFPKVPEALRVRFNDETNDYRPKEIFVFRKPLPGATDVESVDYIGITSETRAIERGNHDIKQLTKRSILYNFDCDIENLYCVKGSLVALAHDTIARHYDSARIISVQTSGSNITGITVDTPLRLDLIGDAEAARFSNDNFDGGAPSVYLTRGAGLTGAADDKELTLSTWIYINADDQIAASPRILSGSTTLAGATERIVIHYSSFGLHFIGRDASGTDVLSITVDDITPYLGKWVHVLASFDLANTAHRHIYIDDTAMPLNVSTYTNSDMDFTLADWGVGARPDGGSRFSGALAEMWLALGTYIDLSDEANRRKFISKNGHPVSLGATGNTPTGGAPIFYLSANDGNFLDNEGTGGNFTKHGTGNLTSESVFYTDSNFPAGVVIQQKDGTTYVAQINEQTETAVLTFATPFAIPGGSILEADCLVSAGPFESVLKRMLVLGVQPNNDYIATITLVDEAENVPLHFPGDDELFFDFDGSQAFAPF